MVLTLKNLQPAAYPYAVRALLPVQFPVQIVILYMIRCTEYVLSPEFISIFRKLDAAQAEALWTMYHAPKSYTLDMIFALIFNRSSWDSRSALRFFIPGLVTRGVLTSREPINLDTPAYIRVQQIIERSDVELLATRASAL